MGLFDAFTGGGKDLGAVSDRAFRREQERLRKSRQDERRKANLLATEGIGISEQAQVTFGDELDLENLTDEERTERSTGRRELNTGLLL